MVGEFPSGSALPSENEISGNFKTNRCTLRQALSLLKDEGLIRPIPRIGWEVVSNTPSSRPAGVHESALVISTRFFPMGSVEGCAQRLRDLRIDPVTRLVPKADDFEMVISEEFSRSPQLGGIVVHGDSPLLEGVEALAESKGAPIVCCGLQAQGRHDAVASDNAQGVEALVEHAARKGHSRIVYVTSQDIVKRIPSFAARLDGYRLAMWRRGLKDDVLLLEFNALGGAKVEEAFIKDVEARRKRGDGRLCVLFHTEELPLQAMSAFSRHGISVPRDVSISCFDAPKSPLPDEFGLRGVTHVQERWEDIGALAADLLAARLNGAKAAPRLCLVTPEFRDSGTVV